MSNSIFSAKFTPQGSTPISADEFQVLGIVSDGSGIFSAFDVQVGNVVYLDTFSSFTAPNTISRYKVLSASAINASSVDVLLKYDHVDGSTPVNPSEVAGVDGFIASASALKKLALHEEPTVHMSVL